MLKTLRLIKRHPLCRGRKVSAMVRVATWQIRSRMLRGPIAVPYVNDAKLLVRRGMRGATGNIYVGLHEFEDMAFVLHALRPDELFVDVGANVGSYTILAAKGIGAKCIAVEPIQSTFESLRENVRFNNVEDRVELLNVGIGAENGMLEFLADHDATNRVALETDRLGNRKTVAVAVRTMDDVIEDQSPAIIKIDVEGFETQVIEGAHETLGKSSVIAVLMETSEAGSRYGFDEGKLLQTMYDAGFAACVYDPFTPELELLNKPARRARNTLLVRDVNQVRDRVRDAPAFRVLGRTI